MNKTFRGYRRANGRGGVRNHVIVLPVDDSSNAACEAVAHDIEWIERHRTSDLSDRQATRSNIAGGMTTIEESSRGNSRKIGRTCRVDGVLDKAEALGHREFVLTRHHESA